MPKIPVNRLILRRSAMLGLAAALVGAGTTVLPAAASANSSQLSIIEDNLDLYNAPLAFEQFRELGANTVRIIVPWGLIAPNATKTKKPNFNASNPNAYPAANWAPYDNLVTQAKIDDLKLDFTFDGSPRWAATGRPASTNPYFSWRPNTRDFKQFVTAVATRYDGHFRPPGQSSPLPKVSFWSVWNEPNFGEDLGPQAIDGSTVPVAPALYRGLLNAGWQALKSNPDHKHDTILIGEFAADGLSGRPTKHAPEGYPGDLGQMKPLVFIRALYCVDNNYKQLRGSFAKARGCPTNAAGSRAFRRQNPGLFSATGVADHPYPQANSPVTGPPDPNYAEFDDLGNLARTLDKVNRAYGSRTRFPIYNTEYGYITHPPAVSRYLSPARAAYFMNWAEYLSWKNPRVKSYMQYLLQDPAPTTGPYRLFASGLETYKGAKKATFYAFRMPVYMPHTSFSRNQHVAVWGDARPAPFATSDGFGAQRVQIQLKTGNGAFKTINTAKLNKPGGYFDVQMKFPSSGTVRLAWTYPSNDPQLLSVNEGQTIYSRSFSVKVH
jgi:hypothetical protein